MSVTRSRTTDHALHRTHYRSRTPQNTLQITHSTEHTPGTISKALFREELFRCIVLRCLVGKASADRAGHGATARLSDDPRRATQRQTGSGRDGPHLWPPASNSATDEAPADRPGGFPMKPANDVSGPTYSSPRGNCQGDRGQHRGLESGFSSTAPDQFFGWNGLQSQSMIEGGGDVNRSKQVVCLLQRNPLDHTD